MLSKIYSESSKVTNIFFPQIAPELFVCALEPGCWCRCRVPLPWSLNAGAAAGCRCRVWLQDAGGRYVWPCWRWSLDAGEAARCCCQITSTSKKGNAVRGCVHVSCAIWVYAGVIASSCSIHLSQTLSKARFVRRRARWKAHFDARWAKGVRVPLIWGCCDHYLPV